MGLLNIWKTYMRLNVAKWAEYRFDFILGMTSMMLGNITGILFIWVLFQHIPALNGWSFAQLLMLNGFTALMFGVWHAFLTGPAPWEVEDYVRNGTFDRYLVRPVNPLLNLLMGEINDDGFGDIISGIAILAVAGGMLGMVWTPQLLAALAVLVISGGLIVFAFMTIIAAIAFWTTQVRAIVDVFFNFTRFLDYPLDIYSTGVIMFLTFALPIGFTSYYPAQLFLGRGLWMQAVWLTPLIAGALLAIAYAVWNIGLKNYTSTGH
jgi:ABC-2 type transport system permease protein